MNKDFNSLWAALVVAIRDALPRPPYEDPLSHNAVLKKIEAAMVNVGGLLRRELWIYTERGSRLGRVDLGGVVWDYSIGLELDYKTTKWNSIAKLRYMKPDLAIFVLRCPAPHYRRSLTRLRAYEIRPGKHEVLVWPHGVCNVS